MKVRALAVAALFAALTACGSSTAVQPAAATSIDGNAGCNESNNYCLTDRPAIETSFNMTGKLQLFAKKFDGDSTTGSPCNGVGGYDDIRSGATVTVYDAAGKVVALGQLSDGEVSPSGRLTCEFPVVAVDIPRGSDFLQVEISHRGKLSVSAPEAEAGGFIATLGDN